MPLYDTRCTACHADAERVISLADFELPIVCEWCGGDCKRVITPMQSSRVQIVKDIEPYTSMVTGETIRSRSHHRNHLRDHGLTEVGNEQIKPKTYKPPPVRADLKAVYDQMKFHGKVRYD